MHDSGRAENHCTRVITVQPTTATRKAIRRSQSAMGLKPDTFGLYQARNRANTAIRSAGTIAYCLHRRAERVDQPEHLLQNGHRACVVSDPTNGPPIDRTMGVGVSAGCCMQLAHTLGRTSLVTSEMLTRIQRMLFVSERPASAGCGRGIFNVKN